MNKKRLKTLFLPFFAIAFLLSTTLNNPNFFEIAKQIEIFTTMFKELNMNYVDDTNPGELMDSAIKSMLNDLDPYTQFYNEQDVEASRINQSSDYTGIGAKVLTLKDKLVIVEPYKDYPADKAGLKAGDEIIKVNNVTVSDFKEDAGNLLQGSTGSEVNITYKRQGKTKTVKIIRESSDIKAVPHYTMIGKKTGYIVLREFTETISSETARAIRALKNKGASQLILDLRANPGGLLGEAVNVVNLFVPKDQLVVTTKSKIKKYNKTYYTQKEPLDLNIPVAVLINDKSASASEIVSGALQDMDRAVVIGTRSFGKGLVQRYKPLTYGTQMKITISKYYTPSGRCIQALDYWDRSENGKAKRIKQENYNAFKTNNGRTVYDGGGIQPDIEIDVLKPTTVSKAIEKGQFIFNYATQFYYNNNVTDISSFNFSDKDFNNFKSYLKKSGFNFETKTEKALKEVKRIAEEEEIETVINSDYNLLEKSLDNYKIKAIDNNKDLLSQLITNEIIKRYFYSEGLYMYNQTTNLELKKALQILNNPTEYKAILKYI